MQLIYRFLYHIFYFLSLDKLQQFCYMYTTLQCMKILANIIYASGWFLRIIECRFKEQLRINLGLSLSHCLFFYKETKLRETWTEIWHKYVSFRPYELQILTSEHIKRRLHSNTYPKVIITCITVTDCYSTDTKLLFSD